MNFLSKIEDIINRIMLRLGEVFAGLLKRITPAWLAALINRGRLAWASFLLGLKSLPETLKVLAFRWFHSLKNGLKSLDFKAKLKGTYEIALSQYKQRAPGGADKMKTVLMAPFLVLAQWLQGLSTAQAFLLLAFSSASFLAAINIVFSGQRLVRHHLSADRSPASVAEEIAYERPEYYKEETRHFKVTYVNLPVYFPKVNEIRSVAIDFSATVSNRFTRKYLEKSEYQLRDHLILNTEPVMAAFPLKEEGREVIRLKIHSEIDAFLKMNNVEGHVEDVEITYILAN